MNQTIPYTTYWISSVLRLRSVMLPWEDLTYFQMFLNKPVFSINSKTMSPTMSPPVLPCQQIQNLVLPSTYKPIFPKKTNHMPIQWCSGMQCEIRKRNRILGNINSLINTIAFFFFFYSKIVLLMHLKFCKMRSKYLL